MAGAVAVEWRAGVGTYARAWIRRGGRVSVWTTAAPLLQGSSLRGQSIGEWRTNRIPGTRAAFTSLTEDKTGENFLRHVTFGLSEEVGIMVADAPQEADIRAVQRACQ